MGAALRNLGSPEAGLRAAMGTTAYAALLKAVGAA
jgi:hypothetical protein